jgi:pimeloyl-ACP methyl ester carboxylesterase
VKLNFKKHGDGEPIIIVHGLLGMLDNWIGIAKELSKNNAVYIVDLRNHGNSSHSDVFNYDVLAEDLIEFLLTNNLSKPILIGHSMGGKASINLVFKNPKIIKKLIIVDICQKEYSINKEITSIFNAILSVEISKIRSYSDAERTFSLFGLSKESLQLVIKNIKKSGDSFIWKPDTNSIFKNLDQIKSGIISDSKIFIPTLFLKGQYSNFIMEEDYPLIYKNFPEAEIKTIANSGHWIHYDNRTSFIKEILNFIESEL